MNAPMQNGFKSQIWYSKKLLIQVVQKYPKHVYLGTVSALIIIIMKIIYIAPNPLKALGALILKLNSHEQGL